MTDRRGFTLVELLVVIGLVALLIALLLPSLNRARAASRGVACLSNLRQMATAAFAYVDASAGRYPSAYYDANDAGVATSFAWDITTTRTPATVRPGLLWQGADPGAVTQCPSFTGGANWLVDPYTGYNYNTSYVGHGQYETIPEPAKATAVRNTPTVALFGDGEWAGGGNKFMRAPFPNVGDASFAGRWAGTQGYRHSTRTNVAYCDGHAAAWGERFTANADGAENVAAGTGFLSESNEGYDLE